MMMLRCKQEDGELRQVALTCPFASRARARAPPPRWAAVLEDTPKTPPSATSVSFDGRRPSRHWL